MILDIYKIKSQVFLSWKYPQKKLFIIKRIFWLGCIRESLIFFYKI